MPEGRPILTAQRREALDLLAKGESTEDIAGAVGVSARTVRRWRLEPAFVEALARVQGDAVQGARAALMASARELAEVVVDLALSPATPEAVRLRAAVEGLDRIGLRGEPEPADGEAIVTDDGAEVRIGAVRYVRAGTARPRGHEPDPAVTDEDEEGPECDA